MICGCFCSLGKSKFFWDLSLVKVRENVHVFKRCVLHNFLTHLSRRNYWGAELSFVKACRNLSDEAKSVNIATCFPHNHSVIFKRTMTYSENCCQLLILINCFKLHLVLWDSVWRKWKSLIRRQHQRPCQMYRVLQLYVFKSFYSLCN